MKILAAADIHLGRPLARVPADWAEEFSPRRAWMNLVNFAVREQVDALLLAGDIVDHDKCYFESYGALRRGLDQLLDAGITVVAVAGNHDTKVLPELHRALNHDSFHLLGEGGRWEHRDLDCADGRQLRVIGYSFPARHCTTSPLDSFTGIGEDAPANVIGLLHGDLDQPKSQYAPVSRHDLTNSGVPFWVLGHIHVPTPIDSQAEVVYPGSLQALSPKETGLHGALLLSYDGNASPQITRVTPAGLRYEQIRLDDPGRIQDRSGLLQTLEETMHEYVKAGAIDAMLVDLSITGESERTSDELQEMIDQLVEAGESIADVRVRFRKTLLDIRPPLPIKDLAEGSDVLAVLARMLLALQHGDTTDELAQALLREAADRLKQVYNAAPFTHRDLIEDNSIEDHSQEIHRQQLISQGFELLRILYRQREEQDA